VTQANTLGHVLPAQIQVSVAEAQVLMGILILVKRRRIGDVQHRQLSGQYLDLACGKLGVDGAFRTCPDFAADRQHILAAQALRLCENFRMVRVENYLQQALAITKVNENNAPVVAAPVHPAGDGNFLTDQTSIDVTAIMGSHESVRTDWWRQREAPDVTFEALL
jgi:hypothetical protein